MNIAHAQIVDDYWVGLYGDYNVIMLNSNGFINATRLCQEEGKKPVQEWMDLPETAILVEECRKRLSYPVVLVEGREGEREEEGVVQAAVIRSHHIPYLNGLYLHPLLIPHVLIWLSLDNALIVSDIFNRNVENDIRAKLNHQTPEMQERLHLIYHLVDELRISRPDVPER